MPGDPGDHLRWDGDVDMFNLAGAGDQKKTLGLCPNTRNSR